MATKIRLESQVQGTLPEANAPVSLTKTPSVSTTEVASQGGLLINIDNAVGDVAKTSLGWIEDEKYGWLYVNSIGGSSAEFDTSKIPGHKVLKLTANDSTSRGRILYNGLDPNSTSITLELLKKYAVPCKPNTKYVLRFRMATDTATDMRIRLATYNATGNRDGTIDSTNVSGTTDLTWYSLSYTSSATATYMTFAPSQINVGTAGSAYWDVNTMTFDEITEPVTNSLTSKSPSLVGFTAVGSTDNVDQSQTTTGASVSFNNVAPYQAQQFTPTKSQFTAAMFSKLSNVGNFVGDMVFKIVTDSSDSPTSTVLASYTMTNAVYNALSTGYFTVNLPCLLTVGTKYWMLVNSTTADASNYARFDATSTSSYPGGIFKYGTDGITYGSTFAGDYTFKTLYYKPSTNFTARQNNDVVSISADSDGFLEGAKIDLENGTFSWDSGIGTTAYDTKPYNSAYFRTVGTWVLTTANRLLSGSTNAELVYKIQPATKGCSVSYDSTVSGGSTIDILSSADGISFSAIASGIFTGTFNIPDGSQFLKLKSNGPNAKASSLKINGYVDVSAFKTLYNFPTNQNLYATYVKTLATATTTATYRATKYGFPAIEFAENVYTFLKTDTTATGSTVAFSADGVTYSTVTDGTNIALTSTAYPIVYVRSNITANRLYVSSNDYNADSAKNGSLKCNVQYKSLTQGLIYEVQDLEEKVNDLYSKPATEVQLYQKPLITQVKEGLFEFFNNSLYFTNLAVRRSVQQAHGIITAPITVANTTTETTVFSVTQGANYLRVGKMIIPRLLGKYSTNGNSDSFTVRVKYGGVTVLSVNSATAPSVTNRSLFIENYNTVRSIGATGTMQTFLQTIIDNVANNADAAALATINSTVAQTLEITVQWNAASVNNTLTIEQGYCEAIDA